MPPYGEPDWASPGDTSNMAATQQSVTMPVSSSVVGATNTNSADVRYVTYKKNEPSAVARLWRVAKNYS